MSGLFTKHKLLAGLIAAAVATGGIGTAVYAASFFGFGGNATPEPEVQLAMVETKDIENTISLTGALASGSESSAAVNSKASDLPVKNVMVKVGDEVKAGDVLFTLDTEDLEIALGQTEQKLAVLERKNEIAAAQEKREQNLLEYSNDIAEKQEVRNIWLAEDHLDDNYVDQGLAFDELYKKYGLEDEAYYAALNAQLEMFDAEDVLNAAYADPTLTVAETNKLVEDYNSKVEAFNTAVTAYESSIATSIASEATARSANRTIRDAEKDLIDKNETLEKDNRDRNNAEKKGRETIESNSLDRSVSDQELRNELKKLRDQIQASTVTAASSGIVTAVNAKVGSPAGTDPVIVTDTNSYNLSCDVDEQYIADIAKDQAVRFTTNATGDDTMTGKVTFTAVTPTKQQNSNNSGGAEGNVASTSGSTDKSRGTYRVLIKVDENNERFRPGMTAKITIITAKSTNVLAVPNECLGYNDEGESIVTTTTDGGATTAEVVVTTGLTDGTYTEVSGDGLTEGTQLVVPQEIDVETDYGDIF